jgi:hypothetical protein
LAWNLNFPHPRRRANASNHDPNHIKLHTAARSPSLFATACSIYISTIYIATMDRDRERDRDRRFVKPTPPYARQHSSPATQCTHHAHLRQPLTCRIGTTDIRIRTDHVHPVLEAALLGWTATAPGHQRVAAPLPPGEAHRPVAGSLQPTHTLPGATAALLDPEAARQRSGDDRAVRAETTTGEHDRARRPVATSLRDETTIGTIALGHPGGMATIHIPARRDHATGHLRPGHAKLRQPEAGACARLSAQPATMSRARVLTGMQTRSRQRLDRTN